MSNAKHVDTFVNYQNGFYYVGIEHGGHTFILLITTDELTAHSYTHLVNTVLNK